MEYRHLRPGSVEGRGATGSGPTPHQTIMSRTSHEGSAANTSAGPAVGSAVSGPPAQDDVRTEPTTPLPPTRRRRLLFALGLGVLSAAYACAVGWGNPEFVSDFDQIWAGARALLQGKDPYAVVGPGREFAWKWPLYYPLPALLVSTPLALLPVVVARAAFAGTGAALLAWGVTRDGWARLPIFLSVPFLVTVELGQWSALLAAAFFLPGLAAIGVAKPNFAIALGAAAERRATWIALAAGALTLLAVSWLVQPGWHRAWLAAVREAPHFVAPVRRPLGFLLLLALLRWRRPEARWLAGLALVPQAPSFYDPLLLAVVCLTTRESLLFAVSTVALFFYVGFNTPQPDYRAWGQLVGNATVWICYLPALAMVLRRPNRGAMPPVLAAIARRRAGA